MGAQYIERNDILQSYFPQDLARIVEHSSAIKPRLFCGGAHTAVVQSTGQIVVSGGTDTNHPYESQGEMIIDYPVKNFSPVPGLRGVISAECGVGSTFLLLLDGQVLRYGNSLPSTILTNVSDIVSIVVSKITLLIRADGQVYHSTVETHDGFKLMKDVEDIVSATINIRDDTIIFLNSVGEVLILNNEVTKYTALPEINNAIQLTGDIDHILALRVDGKVLIKGQIAGLDMVEAKTFTEIESLSNIVAIATGWRHAIALSADGCVYGWGDNFRTSLGFKSEHKDGDGRIIVPLKVIITGKFRDVRCSTSNTFLISTDGSVIGAGGNYAYELGLPGKRLPFTKLDVMVK